MPSLPSGVSCSIEGSNGTPGVIRTPDLLLRRQGVGAPADLRKTLAAVQLSADVSGPLPPWVSHVTFSGDRQHRQGIGNEKSRFRQLTYTRCHPGELSWFPQRNAAGSIRRSLRVATREPRLHSPILPTGCAARAKEFNSAQDTRPVIPFLQHRSYLRKPSGLRPRSSPSARLCHQVCNPLGRQGGISGSVEG